MARCQLLSHHFASEVCAFKPLVLLEQDLACSANECDSTWPAVVELTGQGALYEYVPPPCMHFYFFEGRIATGWDANGFQSCGGFVTID